MLFNSGMIQKFQQKLFPQIYLAYLHPWYGYLDAIQNSDKNDNLKSSVWVVMKSPILSLTWMKPDIIYAQRAHNQWISPTLTSFFDISIKSDI